MAFKIVYTSKFEKIMNDNPQLIVKFIQAHKRKESYFDSNVEIVRQEQRNGFFHNASYIIRVGSEKIFVKETEITEETEKFYMTGMKQYEVLIQLQDVLQKIGKVYPHNVEVVEPYFAATYGQTSFLGMKYIEHKRMNEKVVPKRIRNKLKVISFLAVIFAKAGDITERNAFYDEEKNKIIIYDPIKHEERLLKRIVNAFRTLKYVQSDSIYGL
ncbi:MAG: hypothetical protein N3G80_02270 [Candidatus Micrarchaeota archaeon]|nr:hypothetical protein [Candidatus Micrarchaeota archaeon]